MALQLHSKASRIAGWIAVALSTAIASFWAFWGIIDNFHEGWCVESIWSNLGLLIIQYLSPMLVFLTLGAVSIIWHRVGSVLPVALTWAPNYFAFRAVNPRSFCNG